MKKHFIFLAVLAGFLFAGCNQGMDRYIAPETGVVEINMGNGARTIVPVEWSLTQITKWTITFDSTEDGLDDIVKTIEKGENEDCAASSAEYTLPVGTYTITVEGKGTDGSTEYTLTGSTEKVAVESEKTVSPVIYVSLKKSSDGTDDDAALGFEYTITFSDANFIENNADYAFEASLTPVKSGEKIILSMVGPTVGTDQISYNFSSEGVKVPSGYYYLTVSYEYDKKTFVVPLHDSVVEIADSLKTTGSYDDSAFAGVVTKTFYVDNYGNSDYNGLFPDHKKEFNSALEWLCDNQDEWTDANLYFTTSDISDVKTADAYVKALVPYYNGSYNPTSDEESDDGYNKEVNVYIDGELNYVLKKGLIYITKDCASKTTVCIAESKDNGYIVYDDDVTDRELTLYQISNAVILSNATDKAPCVKSILSSDLATEYNADNPTVYLYLEKATKEDSFENNNISISVLKDDGSLDTSTYTVLTAEDSTYLKCYTALAGQAGLTISVPVPSFEINGENTVYYSDEDLTYTVVDENTAKELGDGYTYQWLLNENTVGTDASYVLNSAKNSYVKVGKNILKVQVGKDTDGDGTVDNIKDGYIEITIKEPPIVGAVYSGKALYSVDLTQNKYAGSVSDLVKVASSFTDFATDNKNYLYEAEVDSNTAKIYQYEDAASVANRMIYSRTIADDDTDMKLYYDSVNDNMYAAYMNTTEKKIYIEKYAGLSKITFDGTVEPTEYVISDTELTALTDFAVYDNGNGSVKLYIISTLSEDTYPKIYYSESLTTSPDKDKVIDLYDGISGVSGSEYSSITDITIIDSYVYALLCERSTSTTASGGRSRGGVVKVAVSDTTDITVYGFEPNGSTSTSIANTDDYDKYFLGPVKFVAVKPKKLYIADEGASFKESGSASDVNRVVKFDLSEITDVTGIEAELSVQVYTDDPSNASNFGYFRFKDVE